MSSHSRVELSELIESYGQLRSVWKVGKKFGIPGQSVHKRLKAAGVETGSSKWSEEEIDFLKEMANNGLTLNQISEALNRTVPAIACKLNELGLRTKRTGLRGPKKIPRGVGYDKASVEKHLKTLESCPEVKITRYAKSRGMDVEHLIQALEKHFKVRFTLYKIKHHGLGVDWKSCEYCGSEFIPANQKARYCSRQCGSDARRDADYFGGKRRSTLGLAEGVCQMCGKQGGKLHSQHVIGKKNDPDNNYLVAMCPGCHRLVGLAARNKNLVESKEAWQNFISFTWYEANGHKVAQCGSNEYIAVECCVDLEVKQESLNDENLD